jgi:hypothetical protein
METALLRDCEEGKDFFVLLQKCAGDRVNRAAHVGAASSVRKAAGSGTMGAVARRCAQSVTAAGVHATLGNWLVGQPI